MTQGQRSWLKENSNKFWREEILFENKAHCIKSKVIFLDKSAHFIHNTKNYKDPYKNYNNKKVALTYNWLWSSVDFLVNHLTKVNWPKS